MLPQITSGITYADITLFVGDITKVKADAIVNAANRSLLGGAGIDGAIHKAAGKDLLAECSKLGGCETGQSKITKGYRLPSSYVIHTVGPIWHGGNNGEDALLASCYNTCLDLADQYKLESIVFCCISTGIYSFPKDRAAKIALETIQKRIDEGLKCRVYICCYTQEDLAPYRQIATLSPVAPTKNPVKAPVKNVAEDKRREYFTRKLSHSFSGDVLSRAIDRVLFNQDRFYALLRSTGEPGVEDLIQSIRKSSFSTAHSHSHHHYPTGLIEHSLGVYDQMSAKAKGMGLKESDIILTALLHDICMARNEDWSTIPHRRGEHGPFSMKIAKMYLPGLSQEVLEAICKHRQWPKESDADRNPLWDLVRQSDIADASTSPDGTLKFMKDELFGKTITDEITLQSYIQFRVPLRVYRSKWYLNLKASLGGLKNVDWHNEQDFHITAAFVKDMLSPAGMAQVAALLDKELHDLPPIDITFDTVKAFTGMRGDRHYVCLSAMEPAPALTEVINKIRAMLTAHGYRLDPYLFHVTLAEIPAGNNDLDALQARIGSLSVPTFSLTLKKAEYLTHERPSRLIWPE